ncbi:MAG: hypothetical protein DRQ39_11135 [Gammaproteobacteria bacterium]|nr:MAG: hypothetical protein DRQ39_11135 [Gammaproteobacteria bacterium]RKZ94242.1 MAG: hypothetical protein DRQ40_06260 [Gammaproteobacteria bacterium]
MAKIWEVDFTSFSGGGSDEPQDSVGSQHLSTVVGTPTKLTTLGGMSFRPGIRFDIDNSDQGYELHTAGATNGRFRNAYSPSSKRSFVLWCYKPSNSRDSDLSMIWGDHTSNNYRDGFYINTSNQFEMYVDSSSRYTSATQGVGDWHMLSMTVDRTVPQTVLYYQGSVVASGTYVPSTSTAGVSTEIGDTFQTREPGMDLGLVSSYDHIVSPTSMLGIYESFLIDSPGGEDPIFTLSGTVFDPTNVAVSGAPVALYSVADNEIYQRVDADSNGDYTIHIPFAGDFVLMTSSIPPKTGARALSLSASGTAGSGTVTFYD